MTVKIEGLADVVKKLESLNSPQVFRRPMRLAVDHIYNKMQVSPPKSGTWSAWAKSRPAARRAYWAKVRSGEAQHVEGIGYVRSGKLKGGWKRSYTNDGRRGVVENDVGYGPYVQGPWQIGPHGDTQYPTVQEIAKSEADTVTRIFEDEYNRQLNK